MEADKEVHQTPFINERGSISSNDLRRRNSWWSGRSRSRPAGCRRGAGCCKPQIACPTGWFPSKISTVLAFNNINTNSMSNRRFPPPHFAILQAGRRGERRNDTWQVEPG